MLFCPTYAKPDGKLAVHKRTLESIDAIIVPDGVTVDVEIATNNPYPITGVSKQDHENTLCQYRMGRRLFLDGDWDALWIIEHDMIIPEDALVKMLNTKADVVYGLYLFRHITPVLNCLRGVKANWADMSVTFFPEYRAEGYRKGWLECSGSGFGCTLIYRRVLEKIDFRRSESGHPVPDMPFANECLRNKFKQVCRFDVPCGHIKPDGEVLWPSMKGGDIKIMDSVKIYIYRTFNANINGKTTHYEEGREAEMPEDYTDEFVRAGFIGIVKDKPAVKVVAKPKPKTTKTVKSKKEAD